MRYGFSYLKLTSKVQQRFCFGSKNYFPPQTLSCELIKQTEWYVKIHAKCKKSWHRFCSGKQDQYLQPTRFRRFWLRPEQSGTKLIKPTAPVDPKRFSWPLFMRVPYYFLVWTSKTFVIKLSQNFMFCRFSQYLSILLRN